MKKKGKETAKENVSDGEEKTTSKGKERSYYDQQLSLYLKHSESKSKKKSIKRIIWSFTSICWWYYINNFNFNKPSKWLNTTSFFSCYRLHIVAKTNAIRENVLLDAVQI